MQDHQMFLWNCSLGYCSAHLWACQTWWLQQQSGHLPGCQVTLLSPYLESSTYTVTPLSPAVKSETDFLWLSRCGQCGSNLVNSLSRTPRYLLQTLWSTTQSDVCDVCRNNNVRVTWQRTRVAWVKSTGNCSLYRCAIGHIKIILLQN